MRFKAFTKNPSLSLVISVLIIAALIVLNGCASPSPGVIPRAGADVRNADMKTVVDCTYLGEVEGCYQVQYTSDRRSADEYREIQMNNARYEALQKAGSLGATHIVWTGETGTEWLCAHGRAYDCSKSKK